MTKLIDAIRTKDSFTENGMSTNSTSLKSCVDLFFVIGAMRGADKQRLLNAFTKAYAEDALTATKILFWARDVRGGAGERQIFRDIITYLSTSKSKETLRKNLNLVLEYGRADDLLVLIGTPVETEALTILKNELENGNKLVGKWMPRGNGKNRAKKKWANTLRNFMGLNPKDYRKILVENTDVVETKMCAKDFGSIEYGKIPSKAMSDYMTAFGRNDFERFSGFLNAVDNGEDKINTGAVYPYDIVKNMSQGNTNGANTQWNALPNFMEGNNERVLPLVDVSSSMNTPAGGSNSVSTMDVAISLGLYISERNEGAFKDAFITFHTNPTLEVVKGTLSERYAQMRDARWGGSTNLQGAFELMLTKAKASNVSADEMPTMMIILSDMEFNRAVGSTWGSDHEGWNPTAHEMMNKMYEDAGYKMPKIVYWNIASRGDDNKPVTFDENGTALVSGFSPALLTGLLGGKDMTPYSMMMNIVDSERYSAVTI